MIGSCETCAFGSRQEDTDEVLICMRFPPVVLVAGDQVVQAQPAVSPTDGCGEHTATVQAPARPRQQLTTPGAPRLRR